MLITSEHYYFWCKHQKKRPRWTEDVDLPIVSIDMLINIQANVYPLYNERESLDTIKLVSLKGRTEGRLKAVKNVLLSIHSSPHRKHLCKRWLNKACNRSGINLNLL